MTKVASSIRLLGAGFLHEMVNGKKIAKQKTYDSSAFTVEDIDVHMEESENYNAWTEETEEEQLEQLLADGDEDAAFIADYEMAEVLQNDDLIRI